ncbi:MAG: acyl-CoA dehydratase activase [Peptococcaceae bacterium]|jgi:predicted CoA-substrate-specific enzyme activase|nr:acyl-CoA dehydratase activase [Peptococcaceae bacterium]
MITAGVDVGLENIKIVILKDGKIAAKSEGPAGGAGRGRAAEKLWEETLNKAGIQAADVSKTVATGAGKYDVAFAGDRVVEVVADARAARYFYPNATSVVDAGADQVRVATLGEGDKIEEVVLNQKCSAGLGIMLKYMGRRLGMTLAEMSALAPDAAGGKTVNDGCAVFTEMDALELLNRNVHKKEVAGAVVQTVICRINAILKDKIPPAKETTVFIGGMTRNTAVVDGLKARSGIRFLIPEEAQYGCAVGAAVIASDR